MTFDTFFYVVRRLGNSHLCRYYLSTFPGKVVIEVAVPEHFDASYLEQEMHEHGFESLSPESLPLLTLYRFAVPHPSSQKTFVGG